MERFKLFTRGTINPIIKYFIYKENGFVLLVVFVDCLYIFTIASKIKYFARNENKYINSNASVKIVIPL